MNSKPSEQLRLSLTRDNCNTLANHSEQPVETNLLERILDKVNLRKARRKVERKGGRAGVERVEGRKPR